MTPQSEGLAEEIAGVLRARLPELLAGEYGEEPRDWVELGSTRRIGNHLADALADLLAARDRQVRAEALREAADETYEHTTIGQKNQRTVTLRPLLGTDVRQWLHDRADRIEAP